MSLRDIGEIINNARNEKERQVHKSLQVQAYDKFSKGSTPLQVAIDLNIGQTQATQFYAEFLELAELGDITKICVELKGDAPYFISLYKAVKAANMTEPQVIEALKIANHYLPGVQDRYEALQKQNNTMESNLITAAKEFQNLSNMISSMKNTLDGIKLKCETEAARLEYLQQQRAKLESFVYNFRNNDGEYTKLIKTIEDEVLKVLSDKKELLKLAVLSIAESVRSHPDKYDSLLTAVSQSHYVNMLLEEAEKLYSSLTERFVREVVTKNVSKQPTVTTSPTALPLENQQNDVPAEDKR